MNNTIIKLEGVWKTYEMGTNKVHALRGLDLEVNKGEFISIMGPSGSGKSTAMNLIGCLDLPTKGKVIPTLTALENVSLPMIFQEVRKSEANKRAKKLLDMLGLGERANHLPGEMSGGQQQRVAIARSLANNPEVILADEPTGNLDSKTGENVMGFLKRLHEEKNTTIILVTHDPNTAGQARKTYHLKDGKFIGGKK